MGEQRGTGRRDNGLSPVPDGAAGQTRMSDLQFLSSLGVPVENIAKRAGRSKTAILYEMIHESEDDPSGG